MSVNYANRGSGLEELVMWSNRQYEDCGIAKVNKIPIPIKILNIVRNMITKAYIEEKSTVDYVGIMQGGKFICFDCKETMEKSFPLKNIHEHQMRYMEKVHKLGGHAFLIIYFVGYGRFFRIEYPVLIKYWNEWKSQSGKRGYASIPIEKFEHMEIRQGRRIALDYLCGIITTV